MQWGAFNPFVLSASLHDGAELITYPFDQSKDDSNDGEENLTPDTDIFHHFASTYAKSHPRMQNSECFRKSDKGGVANGARWLWLNMGKTVNGSLADFSYMFTSSLELTLHLSCCKFPRPYFLVREWEANKEGLVSS